MFVVDLANNPQGCLGNVLRMQVYTPHKQGQTWHSHAHTLLQERLAHTMEQVGAGYRLEIMTARLNSSLVWIINAGAVLQQQVLSHSGVVSHVCGPVCQ